MTLNKIKENMMSIILSLILGFAWAYIIDLGKEQKQVRTEIELIKVADTNQDEKIKKLENSRENLSNYYVTRIEFNKIVIDQQRTSERIESKLDKLIERFYNK